MLRYLTTLAAIALSVSTAHADTGNNETRTGTANASVVQPLVLTHWDGYVLSFGKFSVGTAGTVVVSSLGVSTATGGVSFVAGSSTSADRMLVQGEPNRLISITTGPGTVSNGGATMSFSTTPQLSAGYIPFFGIGYFTVGGTLSVSPGQAGGVYSGSYPVTVAYN